LYGVYLQSDANTVTNLPVYSSPREFILKNVLAFKFRRRMISALMIVKFFLSLPVFLLTYGLYDESRCFKFPRMST